MMIFRNLIPALIRFLSSVNPKWASDLSIKLFLSPQRYPRSEEEIKFWQTGALAIFPSGCKGRVFGDSRRTVWVVHGWEGRASQYEVIIKACVEAGLKVIAWDGPAHGDSPGDRTNMVVVAKALQKDIASRPEEVVSAVIGHSFGAAVSGYACKLGLDAKKLILISAPSSINHVLLRFWQMIQLSEAIKPLFLEQIQQETGVSLVDVSLENYIDKLSQAIQIIHDKSDKEIPFTEAQTLKSKNAQAILVATEKLGHRRILQSQVVASLIVKFLV